MKVKALSRPNSSTSRECLNDLRFIHRNLNPNLHPHQSAREYQRAVQSSKIQQMFAKPFLRSFSEGHGDGVNCMALKNDHLSPLISGAADGVVKVWDIATQKCVGRKLTAHGGIVTGLSFCSSSSSTDIGSLAGSFLSCGMDGYIHRWSLLNNDSAQNNNKSDSAQQPLQSFHHSSAITSIHQKYGTNNPHFATASTTTIDIWNYDRSEPVQSYDPSSFGWGDDTITHLKYNASERDVLGYTSSDRGIGLIDTRLGEPLAKTILTMRSNALEWNPMEPMNFLVANEDHNCYLFDMRRLNQPTKIFKGHVGAVLAVSFSPTGKDFVTGSYDKTIRLYSTHQGTATNHDCYHLKRMQIVRTVQYTMDAKYVISGSDDSNLRLWKAKASDNVGHLRRREENAMKYRQALVDKFKHVDGVRKVKHSVPMPKYIKKSRALARLQKESQDRKQENRIKHSKPGTVKLVAERKKVVVDGENNKTL